MTDQLPKNATMSENSHAVVAPVEPSVRPCPFCGGTNGTDQMGETYRWRLWQCNDCGAKGPEVRYNISGAGRGGESEARQLALEAWNKRDSTDVLAERERCARICESEPERKRGDGVWAADQRACAEAIRGA